MVLAGCGGAGSNSGSSAAGLTRLFSVAPSAQHVLVSTVTSAGEPVAGDYDGSARNLTLVSAQGPLGTHTISASGGGLRLTGDFALSSASEFAPYGLNLLNLRTGDSRTVSNQELVAEDGNRVVWSTGSDNVLEDLATGERTTLTLGAYGVVRAVAGDRVLAAKPIDQPGNTTYDYAVYTTDGTKVAELRKPDGYPEIDVSAINAQGETVGIAYNGVLVGEGPYRGYRLVRWSADGIPTVETSRLLKPNGIADDGTVVGQSLDGLIVRVEDGRPQALIGTPADSMVRLDRTGTLFVTKPDRTLTAYRLR